MLSLTSINELIADEQEASAFSMEDPEAFFLFLANSIDENGELITPVDIEEYELEDNQISTTNESQYKQVEALQ